MDFNWSTFFLEIINFLVLVWLIKHFFYKPVCEIVDKRRVAIDEKIASVKTMLSDAESMKDLYNNRLTAWEEEKNQQQALLSQELEEKKEQQLILLDIQIKEEKQKNTLNQEKQLQILLHKNERQALDQGSAFTARLLQDLSSQDLENKLVELFLKNIENFSQKQKDEISNIFYEEKPVILITSAYPLPQKHKDSLRESMQALFLNKIHCNYKLNPEIIAGLRVNIGSYVMRANLEDELKYFSDSSNGF